MRLIVMFVFVVLAGVLSVAAQAPGGLSKSDIHSDIQVRRIWAASAVAHARWESGRTISESEWGSVSDRDLVARLRLSLATNPTGLHDRYEILWLVDALLGQESNIDLPEEVAQAGLRQDEQLAVPLFLLGLREQSYSVREFDILQRQFELYRINGVAGSVGVLFKWEVLGDVLFAQQSVSFAERLRDNIDMPVDVVISEVPEVIGRGGRVSWVSGRAARSIEPDPSLPLPPRWSLGRKSSKCINVPWIPQASRVGVLRQLPSSTEGRDERIVHHRGTRAVYIGWLGRLDRSLESRRRRTEVILLAEESLSERLSEIAVERRSWFQQLRGRFRTHFEIDLPARWPQIVFSIYDRRPNPPFPLPLSVTY